MPFFSDTDNDGAGWDNALDKAVVTGGGLAAVAGAGLVGAGGLLVATGGAEAATILGAPLGISQAALGAGIAGVGGVMGAGGAAAAGMAQMGIPGDLVQGGIGLAGMVGNGIVGAAQYASDFLPSTDPTPEEMAAIREAGRIEADRGVERQGTGENVVGVSDDTSIVGEDGPLFPWLFGDNPEMQHFGRLHDVEAAMAYEDAGGGTLQYEVANKLSAALGGLGTAVTGDGATGGAIGNGVFELLGFPTDEYSEIQRGQKMVPGTPPSLADVLPPVQPVVAP
ncbi:MAG: hypothetical protein ACKV2T_39050 [Kofleriaceae bacterium]